MKFKELDVNAMFFDEDGDLCQKVDPHHAKTPYCAPHFVVGFRDDEEVDLAIRSEAKPSINQQESTP